MKFSEYPYEHVNMEEVEANFKEIVDTFVHAGSFLEQDTLLAKINEQRIHLQSLWQIVSVRHTIDTSNPFYKEENDYFDQIGPRIQGLNVEFYRALVESPFRGQLEEKWGKQLFRLAEVNLKTFSPEVLPDLQEENALASEYTKLLASAQILFAGEERNLSQLTPYETSDNREVRKQASEAKWGFFASHAEELDDLYDKLVKVRTRIAKKLGYKNFIELAYNRMGRTDYNSEMVANYREQVRQHVVPVATRLRNRQRQRIGVDVMRYYDEGFHFKTGNPKPQGNPDWIVGNGERMYSELSSETKSFFEFMQQNELMDLVAKKGKAVGGYCTTIAEYGAPFIFSNFNGTHGDITVLTHEAGHAFQTYCSLPLGVPEYEFPTAEAAEIHSMSMEFLTWPWMELFFEQDTEKFKFMHLGDALEFVPYGVSVDEFQHFVYANPDATPTERKQAWREIEKKYLPHRDYEDNAFLEQGSFWQKQLHIYLDPFYYIDYTLAQVCAFQFWKKANDNREAAWADYLHLCKQGGSKSFLELVEEARLVSPFKDGCIESVIGEIESWLDSVDDSKL
jgi:M3 family oligoendopeptidase